MENQNERTWMKMHSCSHIKIVLVSSTNWKIDELWWPQTKPLTGLEACIRKLYCKYSYKPKSSRQNQSLTSEYGNNYEGIVHFHDILKIHQFTKSILNLVHDQ